MLTAMRCAGREWTSELKCATGRMAVRHLLNCADFETVLLPSLVPEGVLNPVSGTRYFYNLNDDLMPNIEDMRRLFRAPYIGGRTLIVVIHYFGMMTPMQEICDMASFNGALVLEDHAHCFANSANDILGDFALWSLNKFLPCVDGALLLSRRRDVNVSVPQTEMRASLSVTAIKAYHLHLETNGYLSRANKRDRELVDALKDKSEIAFEEYYEQIKEWYKLTAISPETTCIAEYADVQKMAMQRTNARVLWDAYIPASLKVREHAEWNSCPFAYPIRANAKTADLLSDVGVMASTLKYWRAGEKLLLLPVGGDVNLEVAQDVGQRLYKEQQERAA